ncbi:MAG: asparagine synthase (glutamine-hydrolyzing) [Blastocatellia bacterium]
MCGISGIFGSNYSPARLEAMIASQHHRGPDACDSYLSPAGFAGIGHNRLSIIDLSPAGRQPMSNHDGSLQIVFNGEIYNYLELRAELGDYPYRSQSDTEVLLAAYEKWGEACLDRLVGMFAFLLWDERSQTLFAARDRFGVKPLYYHHATDGTLRAASEIKALHASGISPFPDETTWATYLTYGFYDHSERTFWQDVRSLPPGHSMTWCDGKLRVKCWYDLAALAAAGEDTRSLKEVEEEYLSLLIESVRLRFRSDVPVGINLSGGLDSSTLLGVVQAVQGSESSVRAFTFVCGDPYYDELPWVGQMLERTQHPLTVCRLTAEDVPALADSVQMSQDEPFGGLPTLAYARVFEQARAQGVIVLLDGQGMDEQWAGYDYYSPSLNEAATVQGAKESPIRPHCLKQDFREMAANFEPSKPFGDRLRNLQYRDARFTKIPRALRFNDRISMRSSTELREPFMDHRLFELALRQPMERKLNNGQSKWLLRRIARQLLPVNVVEAPKRPLQTPQREWLRGPLSKWVDECLEFAFCGHARYWLDEDKVRETWRQFQQGPNDNSFFVWQWISVGLFNKLKDNRLPKADVKLII